MRLTLDALDAMIDACERPALVVLSACDHRQVLKDARAARWLRHRDDEVSIYRGVPVWVEVRGRSRVLTAAELDWERQAAGPARTSSEAPDRDERSSAQTLTMKPRRR